MLLTASEVRKHGFAMLKLEFKFLTFHEFCSEFYLLNISLGRSGISSPIKLGDCVKFERSFRGY